MLIIYSIHSFVNKNFPGENSGETFSLSKKPVFIDTPNTSLSSFSVSVFGTVSPVSLS